MFAYLCKGGHRPTVITIDGAPSELVVDGVRYARYEIQNPNHAGVKAFFYSARGLTGAELGAIHSAMSRSAMGRTAECVVRPSGFATT
jgi:hypothetical protein